MPIPRPSKGETKEKFISRCMGNSVMNSEFPKQDQRAAVCHQSWNESNKDGKSEKEEEKDGEQTETN